MNLQNNDNGKSLIDENFRKLRSISARYPDKKI